MVMFLPTFTLRSLTNPVPAGSIPKALTRRWNGRRVKTVLREVKAGCVKFG
jgi:hypothetical protein